VEFPLCNKQWENTIPNTTGNITDYVRFHENAFAVDWVSLPRRSVV